MKRIVTFDILKVTNQRELSKMSTNLVTVIDEFGSFIVDRAALVEMTNEKMADAIIQELNTDKSCLDFLHIHVDRDDPFLTVEIVTDKFGYRLAQFKDREVVCDCLHLGRMNAFLKIRYPEGYPIYG